MSTAAEWFLSVHRFVWYPVLYAMGLERDAIDVPIGGWRRVSVPAQTAPPRKVASSAPRRRTKAA